jgi:UDP-N-acetylglucosamine--dolichyl-phosphate N-acetylglucosaminephosphotransferase
MLSRLDSATGLLQPSTVIFALPPPRKTVVTLKLLAMLGLTRIEYDKDDNTIVSATNLTLYTLILVYKPMREDKLTMTIMCLQGLGSAMAFFVRYGIASFLYDGDRR